MRCRFERALAVTALLAIASPTALGAAVALHLAEEHHSSGSADHDGSSDLEPILHGHAHHDGTPAHGHAFLSGDVAPIRLKQKLLRVAMVGDAPEAVVTLPGSRRLPSSGGPTHDPPPPPATRTVLRI